MKLTENAAAVLERRYVSRDENGVPIEDAQGIFRRVADTIAAADKKYDSNADTAALSEKFYELMTGLEFLPNSPTLMNAGRPLGQLSACFVLPVEDSLEGIFEAIKQAALIHQSGGGTGFSFSRLRPSGSVVRSTGGVASGPVSFMKVFNAATEAIKQGGTRRGANMGVLRVDHPDILEFIGCKTDTSQITNFNISVGITDAFMKAVEENAEYRLIDPKSKNAVRTLNARGVFDKIVYAAWLNGEPGVIFLDRMNAANPVPSQGEIEATNPCGEQPLLPYESCNLGSINISGMIKNGMPDWDRLSETAAICVHFLDNVIDCNKYPLKHIGEQTLLTRKIGLGVMGWADMLFELGIRYDSDEAAALGERVMKHIRDSGTAESVRLAKIRGAYPLCDPENPRRNATITTIAPTGTLSLIAGVSSGIEPAFALSYTRNVMDGVKLVEHNPVVSRLMARYKVDSCDKLPEEVKNYLVTAHDVSPERHVKMQAAFQKYTDNAVSKTVNFPNSASADDVRRVYMSAYASGCKGVTIYRDGSRRGQVLTANNAPPAPEAPDSGCDDCRIITPRPRPEITQGLTERISIGCGNLYVTVNFDEKGICEVFTNTGKNGGCPSQSEAAARLATAAFRAGVDPAYIVKQLKGIRCPSTIRQKGHQVTSCPDAIARVIARVLNMRENGEDNGWQVSQPVPPGAGCPECGRALEHSGGCVICRHCGYSKCS